MKKLTHVNLLNKNRCHLCTQWTPLIGCVHYGPRDSDVNKEIIDAIVAATHGGNKEIIETSDFIQGIHATLILLRENGLLKKIR